MSVPGTSYSSEGWSVVDTEVELVVLLILMLVFLLGIWWMRSLSLPWRWWHGEIQAAGIPRCESNYSHD